MKITKDYLKRIIKEEMNKVLREYQDPAEFKFDYHRKNTPKANILEYGLGKPVKFIHNLETYEGTPFMFTWQGPYEPRLEWFVKSFKEASDDLSDEEMRNSLNKQIEEQRSDLEEVINFLKVLPNQDLGQAGFFKPYWEEMQKGADSYINKILDEETSLDDALKHVFAINTIFYAIKNGNDTPVDYYIKIKKEFPYKNITTKQELLKLGRKLINQ